MSINDNLAKALRSYGSTVPGKVYSYLGDLGFTGTISDRLHRLEESDKKGWQALIERFEKLGIELLFDSGFDNSSSWVFGAGWAVSGTAAADGTQTALLDMPGQNVEMEEGVTYRLSFDVLSISGDVAVITVAGTGTRELQTNELGFHFVDFTAPSTGNHTVHFGGDTSFIGSVDNASVKRIL